MPCDSSHLEPTWREVALRRVNSLLAEIARGAPLPEDEIDKLYGCYGKGDLDVLTRELCRECRRLKGNITRYSLELQIWWRDHQRADEEKKAAAEKKKKDDAARKEALSKLSPAERKLLRI